jgi:hypothetical protein
MRPGRRMGGSLRQLATYTGSADGAYLATAPEYPKHSGSSQLSEKGQIGKHATRVRGTTAYESELMDCATTYQHFHTKTYAAQDVLYRHSFVAVYIGVLPVRAILVARPGPLCSNHQGCFQEKCITTGEESQALVLFGDSLWAKCSPVTPARQISQDRTVRGLYVFQDRCASSCMIISCVLQFHVLCIAVAWCMCI